MRCQECKFDFEVFDPISGWGMKFDDDHRCEGCTRINSDGAPKKTWKNMTDAERKERVAKMRAGRKAKPKQEKPKVIDKRADGRKKKWDSMTPEQKKERVRKMQEGKKLKRGIPQSDLPGGPHVQSESQS